MIMIQSMNCYSQYQNQEKDSNEVTKITTNFFRWYISCAKIVDRAKDSDYNPKEIKDTNGMTTLDFSIYFKNLIEHSFSDSLITKERASYKTCLMKLSKIKYSDYQKLTDLSDFEELNDDFTNYYRWTGGQEMFDIYSVTKVKIDNKKAIVIGSLYFDCSGIEKRDFVREIITTFIKQKDKWKIIDIKY